MSKTRRAKTDENLAEYDPMSLYLHWRGQRGHSGRTPVKQNTSLYDAFTKSNLFHLDENDQTYHYSVCKQQTDFRFAMNILRGEYICVENY
jgi:hypothetical protein